MTVRVLPPSFDRFDEVWLVDTEYVAPEGERPDPVCLVAKELRSGRVVRLWKDELLDPPYGSGADVLFVAYNAVAELAVHRALGWPDPVQILDLYVEYLRTINGRTQPHGRGLLGALKSYHIAWTPVADKDLMRNLIIDGGPWSTQDQDSILDYCHEDVTALEHLLSAMAGEIDLDRALIRGRYMAAVTEMEWAGVPLDTQGLATVLQQKDGLESCLVAAVNQNYDVFDNRKFAVSRFERYLQHHGIAWPRHQSGHLKLDQDTFKERSDVFPILKPICDVRQTITGLKKNRLVVGSDGRNRTWLNPFGSRTGRNQPSSNRFIFGLPSWWRGFIQAKCGFR